MEPDKESLSIEVSTSPSDVSLEGEASPSAQQESSSADGPATSPWEEELKRLQKEVELWKDRALRAAADLENYRRRVQRDLSQQILQTQADILKSLLPLLDNLERGLQVSREAPDIEKLREGLELMRRQFFHTLQRLEVERIEPAVGGLPNPEDHEILSTVPASPEAQPHTIVEVVEAGYRFRGHLLRPARVIVTE
ncbi:MAG: nucleotide exchange factor GrpE [Bacteroidia bacterium]|nr:nucleotide exchange factor GrpE [Bacteroidia bacterium]